MMDFVLIWIVIGCVVLLALGVFGLIVPGLNGGEQVEDGQVCCASRL